jgi:molybdate transport system permease protein
VDSATLLDILGLTLKVGLVSTAVMLVPGVALGWLLARGQFPGRTLVRTLVVMPMVLPPVAIGLLLLKLLSTRGATGRLAETLAGGPVLLTWKAAAIASAVMSAPLLILGAEQAFAAVPRRLEQVATTLGASRATVFAKITLPLALRGLLHGLVFAFARSLGEFGATTVVAGDIPGRTETLALGIYARIHAFQDSEALALAGVSLALALASTWAAERWLRHAQKEHA